MIFGLFNPLFYPSFIFIISIEVYVNYAEFGGLLQAVNQLIKCVRCRIS